MTHPAMNAPRPARVIGLTIDPPVTAMPVEPGGTVDPTGTAAVGRLDVGGVLVGVTVVSAALGAVVAGVVAAGTVGATVGFTPGGLSGQG